jgi:hypothetical protein
MGALYLYPLQIDNCLVCGHPCDEREPWTTTMKGCIHIGCVDLPVLETDKYGMESSIR